MRRRGWRGRMGGGFAHRADRLPQGTRRNFERSAHRNMRILIVIPSWMSFSGFFNDLAEELCSSGVEVHCACALGNSLGGKDTFEGAPVTLHRIRFPRGMNPMEHFSAARQLRRVVETVRPDLIHAHFSAAIFTTALAKTARWPATLATFHGISYPFFKGLKQFLLRSAELWSASRMRCAWVLNEEDRQRMEADGSRANVRVLPRFGLGCDLARFRTSAFPDGFRSELRTQLGIPPAACVFIFVGRFVVFKGFATLVRSFLALGSAHPECRLLLVGTWDSLHGSGLSVEERQAMENCGQIVRVGYQSAVERYLAAADVFVFPSQREGMPVCAMESLAMGVPVITSNARGCRDVVRHDVDGVILAEVSQDHVAAAMERFVTDAEYRARLSENALAGRDRFNRKNYVNVQTEHYSLHGLRGANGVEMERRTKNTI